MRPRWSNQRGRLFYYVEFVAKYAWVPVAHGQAFILAAD